MSSLYDSVLFRLLKQVKKRFSPQLLGLFDDPVISQCAADGFYIIMSTSDDVMTSSSCANMKVRKYLKIVFICDVCSYFIHFHCLF